MVVQFSARKERISVSQTSNRRVVYDTDAGGRVQLCKKCGAPEEQCRCRSDAEADLAAPRDGYIRLARDRKGRGGKIVTIITGMPGDATALAQIAQELRRFCGAGGTIKGTTIEIQGEHRERLESYLKGKGYKVRRVGG